MGTDPGGESGEATAADAYPGSPAQKARDDGIIEALRGSADPVQTTAEVAAELPIGKRATLNRLEDLRERGPVASKDVGVGRVWWLEDAEPVEGPSPASAPTDEATTPGPPAESPARDEGSKGASTESARWNFLGSLGKHSIYAGAFLILLLLTEAVTTQALIPVPVSRLYLTAVVFFVIGFPATGLYKLRQYLVESGLSRDGVGDALALGERGS